MCADDELDLESFISKLYIILVTASSALAGRLESPLLKVLTWFVTPWVSRSFILSPYCHEIWHFLENICSIEWVYWRPGENSSVIFRVVLWDWAIVWFPSKKICVLIFVFGLIIPALSYINLLDKVFYSWLWKLHWPQSVRHIGICS